jgi:hypothetical protein
MPFELLREKMARPVLTVHLHDSSQGSTDEDRAGRIRLGPVLEGQLLVAHRPSVKPGTDYARHRRPEIPLHDMAHRSDSLEQREAEALIRAKVGEHVGVALSPAAVEIEGGGVVQVDGASPDESVLVEIFARQGLLKGGQRHKVATDAFKLITLRRTRPSARLVLAFADEQAAAFATKGSWQSTALAAWGIEVVVVELEEKMRGSLLAAQLRQEMVNRPESTGSSG